jgi:TonB family protein
MKSYRTSLMAVILFGMILLLGLGSTVLGAPQNAPGQGNELDSAASKIDAVIAKKNKIKVIVTDFIGPKDGVTEFGQLMADDLSLKMAKANTNLNLLPRNGQTYTFGNSGLSQDFTEGSAAWFLARSVGTEVVVTGNLEKHSDRVDLNLRVWEIPFNGPDGQPMIGGNKIGELSVRLLLTPDQIVLLGHTVPQDPAKGFRLTAGKKSSAEASFPSCISCPAPSVSGKGKVNLRISISEEGRVTNVELVSASDQKIAEKVVQAVAKWRFRPARGPDGQPVATQIPFEVTLDRLN